MPRLLPTPTPPMNWPNKATQPNPTVDCVADDPQDGVWCGKPSALPTNHATRLLPLLCGEGQPFVLQQLAGPAPPAPRHGPALASTPVTLIAVGGRSQASGGICSADIRQRRSKGNPFIFREVFHLEIIHIADHRNTCKHEI